MAAFLSADGGRHPGPTMPGCHTQPATSLCLLKSCSILVVYDLAEKLRDEGDENVSEGPTSAVSLAGIRMLLSKRTALVARVQADLARQFTLARIVSDLVVRGLQWRTVQSHGSSTGCVNTAYSVPNAAISNRIQKKKAPSAEKRAESSIRLFLAFFCFEARIRRSIATSQAQPD